MNVLGLVMFSIVFGIVLGRMGEKGLPLKAFFETLNEVVMKMVALVMWYVDQFQTRLLCSNFKNLSDNFHPSIFFKDELI